MSRTVAAIVASIAGLVMVLTAFVQPLEFLGSAVVDWLLLHLSSVAPIC